jgi:hypothetical protein
MSFDFSDLVLADDPNDNDSYDYTLFLANPIYDWISSPEEILHVCEDIKEEEKKKEKLQLFNNHNHKIQVITKKYHIVEVHTAKRKIEIIHKMANHLVLVLFSFCLLLFFSASSFNLSCFCCSR